MRRVRIETMAKASPWRDVRAVGLTLVLALALTASACQTSTRPDTLEGLAAVTRLETLPGEPAGWRAFEAGKATEALEAFEASAGGSGDAAAWSSFGRCESAFVLGRFEVALEACVRAVELAPDASAAEAALFRIDALSSLAPRWYAGAGRAVAAIEAAAQAPGRRPSALTRYYGATLGLRVAFHDWEASEADTPFDGSAFGASAQWRVAGPTSLYQNLDAFEATEPERDATLAAEYTFAGFRRRTEQFSGQGDTIFPRLTLDGVYVAETFVTAPRDVVVDVAAYLQGSGVVMIDGEEVLRRDDREAFGPLSLRAADVHLGPGIHRIVIRFTWERNYKQAFGLVLLPANAGMHLAFSATRPEGDAGQLEEPGVAVPWVGLDTLPDTIRPMALYLAALYGIELQSESIAGLALDRLDDVAPTMHTRQLLRAMLVQGLWSHPAKTRDKQRMQALRQAIDGDPSLQLANFWLAQVFRAQELKDASSAVVATLIAERPEQLQTWVEAGQTYGWRGLPVKAEEAWRKAVAIDDTSCSAIGEVFRLQGARQHAPAPEEVPEAWLACDLFRWRYAGQVQLLRDEPATILALRQRDTHRYPDRIWPWTSLASAQLEHVSAEEALATLDHALYLHPDEPELVLPRVDVLLGLSRPEEAKAALEAALREHPNHWELMQRLALLGGRLPLADLASDGLAAIKAYERSPIRFPSSALYVLDYMARRYFEDGSSADVTHNVIKVLSKEGIDEFGEVKFPNGAIPLMVRTVKQDGTVVEPEPPSGKPAISMPSLDVGDYIEFAYLTVNGRIPTERGAVVGADFYFKMANIASAHSQFIVEVPRTWGEQFVALNDAPTATITEDGAMRRYDFLRTASGQPRPEPDSVDNAEYLPHVQMVHQYTWETARRREQNQLAGARAISWELAARTHALVDGAETDADKVRVLFDFVSMHVRNRAFTNFVTPAAHVLESGEGNPLVLFQTMLKVLGIKSSIYRIRPKVRDPNDTMVPMLSKYAFVALEVQLDGRAMWLNPVGRNAVFDYLPEWVQDCPALSLEPGAPMAAATTPVWAPELERRDVQVELALTAAGDVAGTVTETLRGDRAQGRRDLYDELASDDKIRKYLERVVNYDFSGAELLDYTLEGRTAPDAPLLLTYRFRRTGYARPQGNSLVIEDRYDMPDLTRRYARLPDRTVPMLINERSDEQVDVRLTAPGGFALDGPGGKDELAWESSFGSYQRTVGRSAGTLVMHHRLVVPVQRIRPEDYAAFSDWTGDVDRATYGRIELYIP